MENDFKKVKPDLPCQVCGRQNFSWFCKKNSFNLWRCRDCSLIFVFPLPDPKNIYSADYFSSAKNGFGYVDYDQDKLPMIPTFKKYLAWLKQLAPDQGQLLDLGAATGFFVKLAKADGWSSTGVEISDYAAAMGRERGLKIMTGVLTDLSLPPDYYEAVTMLDVLEHLTDPAQTIEEVKKIIKPGGLLLINTPDAGSLIAKILGKYWHLLVPPEHLHYFSQSNLIKFLASRGFEPILIARVGKNFTLEYIFKTLYHWQKLSIWQWLSRTCQRGWLKKINLPIHFRDNILIIARKK